MLAIHAKNLNREYGGNSKDNKEIRVLKNLNLQIEEGEIYGLVGKNGAGKTTLIKILTSLLMPSSGEVIVNGYNICKEENKAKKSMGVVLSNNRSLYLKLTAYENLKFFSELYMVPKKEQINRINYLLELGNLTQWKDEYVENFSHGMMHLKLLKN